MIITIFALDLGLAVCYLSNSAYGITGGTGEVYAVISLAGKQFTVKPEDNIRVPLLDAEVGSLIQCDNVLLYSDGDDIRIGKPVLNGIKVTAEVVRHARDKKIIVFKMKRRKNYRRSFGHRQHFTQIRIKDITA